MNITRTRILTLALTLCFSVQIVAFAADRAVAHDSDYDYDPPVPGTYALPVIKVAPDGAIIDWTHHRLELYLHSVRGAESVPLRHRRLVRPARTQRGR